MFDSRGQMHKNVTIYYWLLINLKKWFFRLINIQGVPYDQTSSATIAGAKRTESMDFNKTWKKISWKLYIETCLNNWKGGNFFQWAIWKTVCRLEVRITDKKWKTTGTGSPWYCGPDKKPKRKMPNQKPKKRSENPKLHLIKKWFCYL